MSGPGDAGRPPLQVISGDASPEEIAALVAVLAAAGGDDGDGGGTRARSDWSSPERAIRPALTPGPGAWAASTWPH